MSLFWKEDEEVVALKDPSQSCHIMHRNKKWYDPSKQILFLFLVLFSLKNGENKDIHRAALHRVKSLLESSQSGVAHLVIVTT